MIEAKVYRKWTARIPPNTTPTRYCCILIDKAGSTIQANMNHNDKEYFNNLLELNSSYRISNFYCEGTNKWQRTLPNSTSLRFGRFTSFKNIQTTGFPEHHFQFVAYNQLRQRVSRDSILTDYIGSIERVGPLKTIGDPHHNQNARRTIDITNLNNNVISLTLWNKHAVDFDMETYDSLEKPVILAASSCWVKDYKDQLQLSGTPTTHCYLNPNINEFNESINDFLVDASTQVAAILLLLLL